MKVAVAHGKHAVFIFENQYFFFFAFGQPLLELGNLLVNKLVFFFNHRSFV